MNGETCNIHPGSPSLLNAIESNLKCCVPCEQGLQVSTRRVQNKAARLLCAFKDKTAKAQVSSMHCFVKNQDVLLCLHPCCTKEPQGDRRGKKELYCNSAFESGRDGPSTIINSDQTPIPFSYHTKHTF